MTDFPFPHAFQGRTVTSLLSGNGGTCASGVWPSANLGIFIPFRVYTRHVVSQFFSWNGSTAAGNIDIGIYNEDGTKVVSTGAVAQAGTATTQAIDVTDFLLSPGAWYFGVSASLGTTTFMRVATGVTRTKMLGLAQMASAHPLPATATFASNLQAYVPVVGFVENTRF